MAYPNIEKTCLEIAYDNGAINRREPKEAMVDKISTFIKLQEGQIDLDSIEIWLGMLDKESFEILCCGDVSDIPDTMANAPIFTAALLDNWFDFM